MRQLNFPILYSFRRCPFAIRARFAIRICKIKIELREILLKHKPKDFLKYSMDGTVPILLISENVVIQESIQIIHWALKLKYKNDEFDDRDTQQLINKFDTTFKKNLDFYKYSSKFNITNPKKYRDQNKVYLQIINERLKQNKFLKSGELTFLDYSIFPFIRQFKNVDPNWFENLELNYLNAWYSFIVESNEFNDIMKKYKLWVPSDKPIITNFIN